MTQIQNKNQHKNKHIPVLLAEVLDILDPKPGQRYLDVTAGYGGHAQAVMERTLQAADSVLIDRDASAVEFLRTKFHGVPVQIIHKDFLRGAQDLLEQGRTFDLVLADLGVSSPHLDQASRGFSFAQNAPLDMRMDQSQEITAATIVNNYSQAELVEIIRTYGEEPKAKRIAEALVAHRPITTTEQLAAIVALAWPGYSKTHPATRTFQALRIAVNNELAILRDTLPVLRELLAPGGRMAVITFHSLEDRIVKQFFAEHAGERYDADLSMLTKKPVQPSSEEIVSNPRARSAKLRAVVKNKNP